ncbi:nickel/cobalt transporter [Glaesserella sp.]|uniref:nickel/cobalt transporter n=1 Tax=Glaesserella sp. TaxID=2094731 RepID=UPI00359FF12A
MQIKLKQSLLLLLVIGVGWGLFRLYPYLLFQVSEWQRSFNLELSASLRALKENSQQAGLSLMAISFLYGVFHAVGPGHGKFVLTSYLSLEKTKLPKAMKITLLSALVQGLVAISLVTVIVVLFTLSRSYFNLTLKWVERGSFIIMMFFGAYWCYQAVKTLLPKKKKRLQIKSISFSPSDTSIQRTQLHQHSENCGCGHKHLPSAKELDNAQDWKSVWLLILSIGLRPCTGAVLVLFLSYTLDLYLWGVASALAMALGTGLTLTLFAWFVLFARQQAIQAGRWYLSVQTNERLVIGLKLLIGLLLIGLGFTLFHSSLLDTSSNLLFKR